MKKILSLYQYVNDRRKPQLARNLHCHCSFKFAGAKVELCYSAEKLFFSRVFSRAYSTARKPFVYRGYRKIKKEQKKIC